MAGVIINPFAFGSADTYFSNVGLLLHMDGANGSTSFPDSSANAHTVTPIGTVAVATTGGVFGQGGDFGGGYLQMPYNSAIDLLGVDATVEGRARATSSSGLPTLVDFRGNFAFNTSWDLFENRSNRTLNIYNGPTNTTVLSTPVNSIPALNVWYAWAVVFNGSTCSIYIDGALAASATYSAPQTKALRIGIEQSGSNSFHGQMDELRITKGVARYTGSSYTLAAAAFPNT